jgi:hypothetical protein
MLSVTVGADRALLRVGDTNLRLELIAGIIALAVALAFYGARILAAMGLVEWLLMCWVGLNVASSILFSPNPAQSLRASLVLVALLAIYLATVLLVRGRDAAVWATRLWVATGGAVTSLGLVAALLYALAGSTQGISLHRVYDDGVLTVVPMVTSTIWEPNLYGAFALSTGLVAASLSLARGRTRSDDVMLAACVTLCFSGAVLSMTRTVWLVGAAGVLVLAVAGTVLSRRRGERPTTLWLGAALAGIVVGAVVALAMPRVSWATADAWALQYDSLEERVGAMIRDMRQGNVAISAGASALTARIDELDEWESAPTLLSRQGANALALEQWTQRPLLGWGTDAFRHVVKPDPHAPAWVPNVALHVLFDTGIVGFAFLGIAVLVVARGAVRALLKPAQTWDSGDCALLGQLVAFGALFLCYQMTDGTWMGFTWFTFALLVISTRFARSAPVRA